MINTNHGKLIQKYREKAGLTQLEFAKQLGYAIPQFISLIENGHSSLPINMYPRVCKVLKIKKQTMEKALISDYKSQLEKAVEKIR